jgi:hypothetical protein
MAVGPLYNDFLIPAGDCQATTPAENCFNRLFILLEVFIGNGVTGIILPANPETI